MVCLAHLFFCHYASLIITYEKCCSFVFVAVVTYYADCSFLSTMKLHVRITFDCITVSAKFEKLFHLNLCLIVYAYVESLVNVILVFVYRLLRLIISILTCPFLQFLRTHKSSR